MSAVDELQRELAEHKLRELQLQCILDAKEREIQIVRESIGADVRAVL